MDDSTIWSVDRLAANNLLLNLGLKLGEEQAEQVAAHFARHRLSAYTWAGEKMHDHVMEELETASMRRSFRESSEDWAEGYRYAEEVVMTLSPDTLVDVESGQGRTKGQLLRAMVREARRSQQA